MEKGQVPWLTACAQAAEMVHGLFTDRDVSFYSLLWRPSDVHQSSPPPYILPHSFLVWGHLRGWGRDWAKVAPSISVNVEAEMKKKTANAECACSRARHQSPRRLGASKGLWTPHRTVCGLAVQVTSPDSEEQVAQLLPKTNARAPS